MSREEEVVAFLRLFHITNRPQRIQIIRYLTSKQCNILREVAYNLLVNSSITISKPDRAYLRRRIAVIKKLASKRFCFKIKKDILLANQSLLKKIVDIILNYWEKE